MSAHVSPDRDLRDADAVHGGARRRATLALGVLVGPVVALANQLAIYAADMYSSCGPQSGALLNLIPAASIVLVVAAAAGSFAEWRSVGRGREDERGGSETRTRFLALLGLAIGAISALIIIAEWSAVGTFAPCART